MTINSKIQSLYDAMESEGADVGTPEEFNSWFLKPGKEGYDNRKSVYNAFKDAGADVGENYEEFAGWLGLAPAGQTPAGATAASEPMAAPQGAAASAPVTPAPTPEAAPAAAQPQARKQLSGSILNAVKNVRSVISKKQGAPSPAPKAKQYFRLRRGGQDFYVPTEEVNEYGGLAGWNAKRGAGGELRVYMQTPEGKVVHVPLGVANQRRMQGYKYSTTTSSKAWQPTIQRQNQTSEYLRNATDEFSRHSKAVADQVARAQKFMSVEGRQELSAAEMKARMAGTPTTVAGIGASSAQKAGAASSEGNEQSGPNTIQSPVVYDVVMGSDGKPTAQWLLPDGTLTTDLAEADMAEAQARKGRLQREFKKRMQRNGLDVQNQDDVRLQMMADGVQTGINMDQDVRKDMQRTMAENGLDPNNQEHILWVLNGDGRKILQYRLTKAEERLRGLMDRRARQLDAAQGGGDFASMLGSTASSANRNMHSTASVMGASQSRLDRDIEAATAEVAKIKNSMNEYDQQSSAAGSNWFVKAFKGVWDGIRDPNTWTAGALDLSMSHTARNADLTSSYGRNLIESYAMSEEMMSQAPNPGGWYSGGRFVGEMLGDPVTYASLATGAIGRKIAEKWVMKATARGMANEVAKRYTQSIGKRFLKRYVPAAAGSAANFAAFEGLRDMRQQWLDGGYTDDEGNFHEGFSWWHALKQGGHGALMGTAMGIFGAGMGNVGDYVAGLTDNVGGKMAVHGAQHGISLVGEGTIFAMPDIIEFHTMGDEQFDKLYAEKFGYADETDAAKRKQARDAARNSLTWDAWTESQANIIGMKLGGLVTRPKSTIGNVKGVINLLRKKDARDHRSFGERVAAMLDRNPFGLELTTEERDELRRAGYGELADLFRKDGASTAKAKDGAVELYHESVEEGRAHYRTRWQPIGEGGTGGKLAYEGLTGFTPKGNEFDGYSEMERLMNDRRVSQSARAKAYYILTGHLLSPGTVMDYTTEEDADGIIVKSMTVNGDVVTSRRFKDKESAQREIDKIVRQSELNSIDVGEHYHDGEVRKGLIKEACKAAGFPPDKASPVYERAMRGEEISAAEREMVEAINKKIREMGRSYMATRDAERLREVVKGETGIDVDEALHKMPRARTENEQAAIDRYMEKLYPEEARRPKQADSEAATNPYDFDEPTPEQSDAQQAYFEGQKLNEAYHDPSDPAKQAQARANADAIALQMQEAFQLVHEYFDTLDNPDDWKDRLAADPWEVLNDPELPAQKRDDVLYYINSKAALDGIMDAANEAADSRIAEVQRSVDLRTHKETGMVHPATLKVDDKQVYIVRGNVQMFPDGSAVDSRNSSESIVVCDPASGEYSFKSPDAIMRVDEPLDPQQELQTALDAIEADRSSIFGENMTPPTEAESRGPQDNDAEGAPVAMTDTPARETSEGYRNDELGISNDENPEKDVTLSGNTEKANAERESGPEQSNDERTQSREDDGSTMAGDAAGSMARDRDRGDIRVYEPGLASERNGDSGYSARDRREAESERLVGIAKKQGQYVPLSELRNLGERRRKATGESEVYEDLPNGRIYKVKNPYAKAPMKGNVQPEDAIYEHLVHNKYFPETPYRFEGISDDGGDVRIVLSQGYVESVGQPTKEQIDAALAERGLYPEGNYRYGNDEISVTDVTGDNALLGADGKVYFIDPIIDFKRPVREILGEAEGAGGAQVTAPMPMRKVKVKEGGKTVEYDEPDYMAVSPRRGHAYIFNESGLDRKEANELLDNLAKEAKDKLDKHNKAMPKIGTSVARFKAQKAAWEQRRAELQRSVDYWNEVKAEQRKVFDAEQALVGRVEVTDNEWTEGEGDKPTYKREIIIDGTHKATQVDAPDEGGHYTGSYFEFDGKRFGDIAEIAQYIDGGMKSEPTEAQKAAGNYKMEHRRIDGYNISIENPKGSVRRGTSKDKDGNETPWETTMQNDYGYIRGTEGVDGDHIDVFLSDTPEEGDVFVVDQVNKDGSFDEHKVMYGFPSEEAAREAYLSNYEPGWTGLGAITHVSKEEFQKWIGSSIRKTKPFAEYKSVKPIRYDSQGNPIDENGNLIIEDVKSVADITDADFTEPTRTVGLPTLSEIVQRVLSTNGKKVIIKKNIFERNALRHDELTPEVSRAILNEALYNPTLYGKNKPLSRPNNWIVINVPDGKGNNKLVVLEVNENKDNVEIVHWHEVDNRGLEKIKRQAEREDGQLLILPSESSEEAGALSGPTFDSPNEKLSPSSEMRLTEAPSESEGPDLVPTSDNVISSDRKVNTLSADKQAESAESSRGALSASPQHSPDKSGSAFGSHDNSEPYTITPTKYEGKHKTSDVWLVKFNRELTAEEKTALDTFAREPLTEGKKTSRGWYDRKQGGYMMRSEEAAKELADMLGDEEAVADRQPLTPSELREATAPAEAPAKPKKKPAPMNRVNVESLFGALKRDGEAKLSDHAEPVQYKDPLTEDVIATLAKWDMSPTHKLAASRLARNYSISYVRAERILREIQELSAAAQKEAPKSEPKPAEPAKEYEVSDEELGDIFKEMRDILGTDDADVDSDFKFRDPEEMTKDEKRKLSALGMRAAMALIERGKTSFTDYARAMIGGLGDDVRPWLKSFYEAARLTPGFEDYDLSDREEVMATDIANFDKQRGPIAAANTIATERKAEAAVAEGEKSLKETRNKQRRENDKQTETDTAALAEKAEAVAGKAEGLAETSEDTGELSRASAEIDKTLDEVNDQLALLGYYEAEEVDKDFNEAYGYMRNAERKAVNDAVKLAKQLVTDLGIDIKVTGQITPLKSKGKSKKTVVSGNVAPAGGDVSIRLPLNEGRELYINIGLEPAGKQEGDAHNRPYYRDDLHVRGIMYRVEWPDEKGHTSFERMGRNRWADDKVTYGDLLNAIRREAKDYLPTAEAAEPQTNKGEEAYHGTVTLKDGREAVVVAANHVQNIGEPSRLTDYIVGVKGEPGTIKIKPDEIAHAGAPTEEDKPSTHAKAEKTYNGYKIGDEVMWDRYGNGKWEKQRIIDFDAQGHPIFDSYGQSWITEVGDRERIKPVDGVFGEAKRVARVNAEKKAATQSAVELLRGDKKSKKKSVSSQKKPEVKPEQPIGDLFGGLFDNEPDNERTEVGTGSRETGGQRQQLEPNPQVGGSEPRRETERPAGTAGGGSPRMDSDADRAGGRGLHDVAEKPALAPISEKDKKNTHNNHVERGTEVAPKTEGARIKANIAAIETMKRLMESGEAAKPADMKKLRAYSGWGGLGSAFTDPETSRQLKGLLGEQDYNEGAEMSRNSAYFTPAYIVDTMWDLARLLGFKGGRMLEGSAGIGNILGLMPQDFAERTDIRAIEKDPTTGAMLRLLYPDSDVDIDGFEKVKLETGGYDLVMTNVPFVPGLKIVDTSGDGDISKRFHTAIHDFCIAKGVRKLRDGGIGIFISTAGSMDATGKLYEWLNTRENADIIGLFRMHRDTFGGTNATTDIILVRKRVNGVKSPLAIDCGLNTGVRVAEYDTGETNKNGDPIIKRLPMSYNRYLVEHPEYVAGEMRFGFEEGDTFRPESKGCYPVKEKDQPSMLQQWVADMAQRIAESPEEVASTSVVNHRDEYVPTYDKVGNEVKTGTIVIDTQGHVCVNYDGTARPLMSTLDKKNPKSEADRIAQFNKNKVKGRTRVQVVQDYNAIKKALNELLEFQKTSESDEGLKPKLAALNRAFDQFVSTYGHLHGNNGLSWLRNDVDYPSVFALETYREEGLDHKPVFGKADIFTRRVVVRPEQPKATTVRDGVTLSIRQNGVLDTRFIAEQLGKSEDEVKREVIEAGLGYENPLTHVMEAAHEYLSGNVREKLHQAETNNEDGRYSPNITALRKVVPHDIPSHFIEFSIGSSWIRPEIFEEYIKEKTGTNVKCTYAGGMWDVDIPRYVREQDKAFGIRSEICDKVITGSELIAAAMTNRTIRVTKTQKDGPNINDPKATSACAAKVDEIRDDFKSWLRGKMQANPELANEIEVTYNDIFNNSAPMTIPDEYVPEYFDGAARSIGGKDIKMRKHQSKAIVRGTMQSLMLAHEVGTGKTFTLITTAMEMRRLGTAKKPMIVVQNATLGQFVASAKALYPDARILSLDDKDRNAEGRKDFYAKIRYNDWDMVVIPQSVLERIPDHPDRERRFIEESIEEKMEVIEAMSRDREQSKAAAALKKEVEKLNQRLAEIGDADKTTEDEVTGDRIMAPAKGKEKDGKKAAITKENAKTHAEEMLNRATDNTLNFDDLGVDAILVDEAHEYKHLGFATAMQRGVKGVDPSYSKKCQGLYLKVKAVQEKSGGRNVIFATGTPISNTAAEIWTFMRYLLPREVMEGHNIWHFDDFVRNFGSIQQMLEFTTAGSYKENNRFAGYTNLPELARIWAGIADTVLTAEAGEVKKQIPELEGDKPTDIYLPQTNGLRAVLKYVRAQLKAYEEMSGQEKKENSHIPLVMYGIAKAAAIDARLVMPNAPDDPHSKTNEAVRQTLRSLDDSKAYNGTVAIFADNYQRKNKETGAVEFNLFEDIRDKLIAQGVPAEQVVIMRDGMTDKKKEKIFAQVNAGEVRVILGTTQRLGVGVNIQERLHTLMHIDAPNRPMDYWQRMGRLLRQGNLHKEMGIPVRVIRFGVEDSLDVTAYQRLKTKGAIADAIMHSKALLANNLDNRVLEEEGDEFGNITAELSGSQYAMLLNQAEKELRKLLAAQDQHRQHQMYIHRAEPRLRETIERMQAKTERSDEILALLESNRNEIRINGKTYKSRNELDKVYEAHNKSVAERKKQAQTMDYDKHIKTELTFQVGELLFGLQSDTYRGIVGYGSSGAIDGVIVRQKLVCPQLDIDQEMGDVALKRIINVLFDEVLSGKQERTNREGWVNAKERAEADLAQILKDKGKPFEHGDRIAELQQKVDEYTEAMQAELKEKEDKYAAMDAEVEEATDITFTEEDDDVEGEKNSNGDGQKFRLIEDSESELLDFLNAQRLKPGWRYAQWADYGIRPPMTAKVNGEWRPRMQLGRWEQSEEGMMNKDGKADLVQGNGRTTGNVAYNPYFHIRTSPMNDQFSAAWDRPELLPIFGYYPESEETSGYHAEGAKNSVGLMSWHSGTANGQLTEGNKIKTMLSRYFKPERIASWSEVADEISPALLADDVRMPINVVPPMLRAELAKRGVKFGPISGSVSEADVEYLNDILERVNNGEWNAGLERAQAYVDAYESRPEVMGARVDEISQKLHTPMRVLTPEETAKLPTRRERRAKGWYDPKTGEIVINLVNNDNVADVENTALHEAAGHYGLSVLVGEENMPRFLDEVYNHSSTAIRNKIDAVYEKRRQSYIRNNGGGAIGEAHFVAEGKEAEFRRDATEEYMSDLGGRIGEKGFEKMEAEELTFWGKVKELVNKFLDKFLRGLNIAKSIKLSDKHLGYILYKSWKNLKNRGPIGEAEDITMRRRSGYDETPEDELKKFRDGDSDMGLEETITKMKADAAQANADNLQKRNDAMRAIGANLNHLRSAMARQREYDLTTVRSVTDLAKILMDANLLDNVSKSEMKTLLGTVNQVVGRKDVTPTVQRVMDLMVKNQLRNSAAMLSKLLSIRGSKVDAKGVEVQGELDAQGQEIARVMKKIMHLPVREVNVDGELEPGCLESLLQDATDRMGDSDPLIAEAAANDVAGLNFAMEYAENVTKSKAEEQQIQSEMKKAEAEKQAGRMTPDAYKQFAEAAKEQIRTKRIERVEAYHDLIGRLAGELGESVTRAAEFKDNRKNNIADIHHNANSDMEGRPLRGQRKDSRLEKLNESPLIRMFLEPLATFDQMLRMFGGKNANGEGYLWNRFMHGWVKSAEREQVKKEQNQDAMDAEAAAVLGKKKCWNDLYDLNNALPKSTVSFWDGGEMREHEMSQLDLLTLLLWDAQPMGRATLRKMNVDDAKMAEIEAFIDPRLREIGRWMVDYLSNKRLEFNEVHKEMFGASMAANENYFPFRRAGDEIKREVENGTDPDNDRPSTTTGSIIKRRFSVTPFDIVNCNAADLFVQHLNDMEHWAAFGSLNRDLGILLSYKRFKQQVKNMRTIYGSGSRLWKLFSDCCAIATESYQPKTGRFDKALVRATKGVAMGKVNLRPYTALKQTLSLPAFLPDCDVMALGIGIATAGIVPLRWCWENMPLFRKRILSRTAGDYRLKASQYDTKIMKFFQKGMLPNIGVDAWTVAVGCYSVFKAREKRYIRQGMSKEQAKAKAIRDAEISFNESQQSSEGPFLAPIQVDHSAESFAVSLFRNSAYSYTRKAHEASRNLRNLTTGESTVEFMKKQLMREGMEDSAAEKEAKRLHRKAYIKNSVQLAVFGWILPWLWRLGGLAPLLLLSSDDDQKEKAWNGAIRQSMFGPIEGTTAGDVTTTGLNMAFGNEDVNWEYVSKQSPIFSDMAAIQRTLDKDAVAATNDVLNIIVGMGTGLNPQTVTDMATAIVDACDADPETSREAALLWVRLLNVPQSQIDQIYFEEVDMNGREASKLSPEELAERYAEYKTMRNAPLTQWIYNEDERDEVLNRHRKHAEKELKEVVHRRVLGETGANAEDLADWEDEYKATEKRLKRINDLKEHDKDKARKQLHELIGTPEYHRYRILKRYHYDVNELTKQFLSAKTAEERDTFASRMKDLHAKAIERLERSTEYVQQ